MKDYFGKCEIIHSFSIDKKMEILNITFSTKCFGEKNNPIQQCDSFKHKINTYLLHLARKKIKE